MKWILTIIPLLYACENGSIDANKRFGSNVSVEVNTNKNKPKSSDANAISNDGDVPPNVKGESVQVQVNPKILSKGIGELMDQNLPQREETLNSPIEYVASGLKALSFEELKNSYLAHFNFEITEDNNLAEKTNLAEFVDRSNIEYQPSGIRALYEISDDVAGSGMEVLANEYVECGTSDAFSGPDCMQRLLNEHGYALLRRPLSDMEKGAYQNIYATIASEFSPREGVEQALRAMLSSPSYLYRTEIGHQDADTTIHLDYYELASALSYTILQSPPDPELLNMAANGSIVNSAALKAKVQKMLEDPKAITSISNFYQTLFLLKPLDNAVKNDPIFNDGFKNAAQNEFDSYIADYMVGNSDFKELLTTDESISLGPLNEVYETLQNLGMGKIQLNKEKRSGILTSALMLAGSSNAEEVKPVHMAFVVLSRLLCQTIPAPPPNALQDGFVPDPTKSVRENFEIRTSSAKCAACHSILNPVGFAFSSYDPVGKYINQDKTGFPVDTSGTVSLNGSSPYQFNGVPELADILIEQDNLAMCHASRFIEYAIGLDQSPSQETIKGAADTFRSNFQLADLIVSSFLSEAFRKRSL